MSETDSPKIHSDLASLTEGELEVFLLFMDNLRPKEIADQLGISYGRVSQYKTSILQKLGVTTNVHLWEFGRDRGYGHPPKAA